MPLKTLTEILEIASRDHAHLCPRQVLGARLGQAGLGALGFDGPLSGKPLLIIAETDGCFLDGLSAATGCTPGHRTLRIVDLGKTAAIFVHTATGRAVRVVPRLDLRTRAAMRMPAEPGRYIAQLKAYEVMACEEMFTLAEVRLLTPIKAILSRPGVRVSCAECGEEVINERTTRLDGREVCFSCAHVSHYTTAPERGA